MCRSRTQPVIDENELSMADYSRSTDERQDCYRKEDGSKIHVSGRHGGNIHKGTGLLFLVVFSLLCDSSRAVSNPCIVTIEGTHKCTFMDIDEPAIFVEYGSPVYMVCKREWSSRTQPFWSRQVSDFTITLNNEIVQPVTDFGPDEVRLPLNTLPPSTNTAECRLKLPYDVWGQTELIYRSTISVGFKPKKPRSFKCVSHNLEKLVCTWDPEPNTVPTSFSLRVSPPGRSAFVCPASQAGSKIPPNSCVWDTSTDPPHNPAEENYTFLLDGANTLGKISFAYNFRQWENVIPSQPVNLLVINKTHSSALLRWSVPRPMRNFPPGLHHRVSYQAQSDSRKTWRTIDVTNETHATEIFFRLTELELADTVYNVRVFMKSSLAVSEDMWSQPAETIFQTAVSPHNRPPKPNTVDVDRIGSDSVEVRWELTYFGRISIVRGFNIYYCPALSSQNCTGPTMKTFVKGDQHLTVGTVRDLKPDTTYKLTVAVLSEDGEGLHSAPWYFTTTKAEPDLSSIEKTIRVAIEQSSSGIKDFVKDLMKQYKQNEIDELRSQINDSVAQVSNLGLTISTLNARLDSLSDSIRQRDKALDDKLNGIDEINSRITNAVTQVSNLTLMPVSALNVKLDSLSESTRQRDEALDRKLDGIGDLESRITNATTQVSNLMLSLSDSIKQRDEALGDKLNGIFELNSRMNDSVTKVSNLTPPISALNVKIDSLSESTKQRDEALNRKLDEIGDLKSGITNATTQVSNLMLSLSDSIKQRDEALGDKLNGIDEINSRITNAVTQVSNLTLMPVSALNVKLDSLSESTRQRDEALDRKLDGIDELKSKITETATQVSNLKRPIVAFDAKLDLLSDSIKQRDETLGDKLGGIDELNARINDSVTEVSNLGQTISAYKVELVSLSEENCQVRENLTQCERDLAGSFGQAPNW